MANPRQKPLGDAAQNVPRSEVAPTQSGAPYRFRPSEADVARFLEHVRRTGQPEMFPTICRTTPPADSRPVFLRNFDVERRLRPDGDEAPCPICSPQHPKFLHDGFLTWYPDEGVIRGIGPECGDRVFGGNKYAVAKSTFKIEERERRALDFLEKNLRKTLAMVAALEAVRPAVREADRLFQQFSRTAPAAHALLRRIKSLGGDIWVSSSPEGERAAMWPITLSGEIGERQSVLGRMPDTSILNSKFDATRDLGHIEALLAALPRTLDEQEAFYWIADNLRLVEDMERAETTLRRCSALYVQLCKRLDQFPSFFSAPLFGALDAWGQHPSQDIPLAAMAQDGRFTIRYGRTYADREEVKLVPDLLALGARGDWPGFE